MTDQIDSFDFEHAGRTFRAAILADYDHGAPWDNEDGHGPVTDWERRAKAPGELVLCGDGRGGLGTDYARRFYDFAEAVQIARRDSWGFLPGPLVIETEDAGKLPYERRGGLAKCEAASLSAYDSEDVNRAIRAVYDAFRGTMTAREYAARAAWRDFERLRDWCNDSWFYVGVSVAPLCKCCGEPDEAKAASLWGIESDAGDYLRDVARELADELTDEDGESV